MIRSVSLVTTALLGALLLHVCGLVCQGHEGPSEVIRRLSRDIDAGRGTAETYLARAVEYRILKKPSRAARDLRLAAQTDPDLVSVWRESAQVFLDLGDPAAAVRAARTALAGCDPQSRQARVCHLLLAQTLRSAGSSERALEVINGVFSKWPEQGVDAFWLRAKILGELDRTDARTSCLQQGWAVTGSEVLRIAWIEACIESGHGTEVLDFINQGVSSSRLKSAWRIRRAQVMIHLDRNREAEQDLTAAVEELDARINPLRPSRSFVADREVALRLIAQIGTKL